MILLLSYTLSIILFLVFTIEWIFHLKDTLRESEKDLYIITYWQFKKLIDTIKNDIEFTNYSLPEENPDIYIITESIYMIKGKYYCIVTPLQYVAARIYIWRLYITDKLNKYNFHFFKC